MLPTYLLAPFRCRLCPVYTLYCAESKSGLEMHNTDVEVAWKNVNRKRKHENEYPVSKPEIDCCMLF